MATQKVGLTKLGLKKNTNLISLEWNEQIIEIKEYLPIEDKLGLIERVVNLSLDDNNFANPARIEINSTLEIIFSYTNINFTEKQKENKLNLYDLLVSSGIKEKIFEIIPKNEINIIMNTIRDVVNEIYKYKDSLLGILQTINEDYKDLDLDAEKIREKIGNKENVEFLKDVMDKMG